MNRKMTYLKTVLLTALFAGIWTNANSQEYYKILESNSELVSGEKYLIVGKDGNKAYALSSQNDVWGVKTRAYASVSIVNGVIITSPATSSGEAKPFEIPIVESSGKWVLRDSLNGNSKYLAPRNNWLGQLESSTTQRTWNININQNNFTADIICTYGSYNTLRFCTSFPWSPSTVFGCFNSSSGLYNEIYLYKKQKPLITITSPIPASITGLGYYEGDINSVVQSFKVKGEWLKEKIIIKAPENFEISTSLNAPYSSSLDLTNLVQNGAINETTIYVRLSLGRNANIYNNEIIEIKSTGATTKTISISGEVIAPSISRSATLSDFSYIEGVGPSVSQSFTVSGSNLITGITVNAPANFEISSDNTAFGSSLTLPESNHAVNAAIYVRLVGGLAFSTSAYSGNITFGYRDKTIAPVPVSGSVKPVPMAITNVIDATSWEIPAPAAGETIRVYEKWTSTTWTEISGAGSGSRISLPEAAIFAHPCEELLIEYVTAATNSVRATKAVRIPKMVSADATINAAAGSMTEPVCAECDIVVLDGATLTSAGAQTNDKSFKDVFLMPGAKLETKSETRWNVHDLYIKAGNFTENIYNNFPTALMKMGCNDFAPTGQIKYVRQIDDQRWYFISFPYNVKVADITTLGGSLGRFGVDWYLKKWNGQHRADTRSTSGNWDQMLSTDTLKAYVGYTIGLADGRTGNGLPTEVEIVFPLQPSARANHYADADVTLMLKGYNKANSAASPLHDNWNVVGAPYFGKNNGLGCGKTFVVSVDGISNVFQYLTADPSSGLHESLNPFVCYYVQSTGNGDTFTFRPSNPSLAPSAIEDLSSDIRIHYQSSTGADYMNLILDDNESDDYHFGTDLVKWIGTGTAIPQIYMNQGGNNLAINAVDYASATSIPVAVYNKTAGAATFHADREGAASQLTALILTDTHTGTVTNLLADDYSYLATAGTDATRFILSAQRMPTGTTQTFGSDVVISASNGLLRIEHLALGSSIRIFDTLGRVVSTRSASADVMEIVDLPKGIYIVQTSNQQGTQEYKILL